MVIGAGINQVPLIKAARREGYRTIACDLDEHAPGASWADDLLRISTKDREDLLRAAKENRINGIAANSEYAMCDAAHIANELGLVGNPEEAVAILSSKSRFRTLQKETGLFAPAFLPIGSACDPPKVPETLSFPALIKPDQSSGSRGMVLIQDPVDKAALAQAVRACTAVSRNRKAILEEYVRIPSRAAIEGEIFVHHGEILWDGLFNTIRSEKAEWLPMTYIFPLREAEERIQQVKNTLAKAFAAAGILHGEYNTELFFTPGGEPFLLEINPRQGGYGLPGYVQEHCGIDYHRLLVTTAMGEDDYWNSLKGIKRNSRLITHHMLFPGSTGVFEGIRIPDFLRDKVYRIQLDIRKGDPVSEPTDASSEIGYVDLCFESTEEQEQVSLDLEQLIQVEIGKSHEH